jgi:hypothetical protein
MRQLQPNHSVIWSNPSQPLRLRWEIECNHKRLLEIALPETARVFQMLISDAQAQLERVEGRSALSVDDKGDLEAGQQY